MSIAMSSARKPLPEPELGSDYEAGGKPLTGWTVLAMIVAFFGFVALVDGLMTYQAIKTFSGEVVAHPYEHGIAYNHDIAQAREQAARDWKVEVRVGRAGELAEIRVTARDADGADVTGVDMTALFAAPADLSKDVRVKLEEASPGRYVGKAAVPAGQRDLVLTAARGGAQLFRSKNRIDVN